MRLSSSISKSLVLCLVLLASQILFAAQQPRQEIPAGNFDNWLQKGQQILKATRWDPAELQQTAQNLASGATKCANDEKGSEALLLSARLYAKAEKYPLCVKNCLQLLDTYPKTTWAPEACELAGTIMADCQNKSLDAAKLFEKRILAFPKEKEAERFLHHAYQLYARARDWNQAADCAQRYLDTYANGSWATEMRLNLAQCWWKQGKTERAQQELSDFAKRYPKEAPSVVARLTLGELYWSKGATQKACEQWQQAWTLYGQLSKSSGRMNGEVRSAAAQALWNLQSPLRTEYRQTCAFIPNSVSQRDPRPLAKTLISNYDQIMTTDAQWTIKSCIAQGEVCEELGNFLLQQGYVRYAKTHGSNGMSPDKDAKDEYRRAIGYYEQAWQYAQTQQQTPKTSWWSDWAAARAVELRFGNGDLAYARAAQLRQALPAWRGTTQGLEQCFDGLNTKIYPMLMEGLTQYREAQAPAKKMGQSALAERARYGLIKPFESFMTDLMSVNQSAWEAAKTAATQVAGSVKMSQQGTALPQYEQLKAAYDRSYTFAQQTTNRSREILMALRDAHIAPEAQTTWDERVLKYCADYAGYCRDMATKLDGICGEMKGNKSTSSNELWTRIHDLSQQWAAQEYSQLQAAYQLCEEWNITCPTSDKILERLVALNPKQYRDKADTQYGTRQKR
jgi:tetratricopeptide (TPR) repeat protein